jgi:predicted nucleic acid-binding protein
MVIVDAGALYEVLAARQRGTAIERRLEQEDLLGAPHVVDVEVLGVIRRQFLFGALDRTAANLAVQGLRNWPGERFGHRGLLQRAWQLRHSVRTWDAIYVALAEALEATLLTTDERLARVGGLYCTIEVAPN